MKMRLHRKGSRSVLVVLSVAFTLIMLVAPLRAETPAGMFQRGENLAEKGQYEHAIQAMLDFQAKYPDHKKVPEAQYLMGVYQQRRNYLNNAIKEYKMVIEDFPRSIYAARARLRMADVHMHMEKPEKTVDVLEELAEEFKGEYEAFHGLRKMGEVYLKMKNEEQASEAFERASKYNVVRLMEEADRKRRRTIDQDIHRAVFWLADRAIKREDYDAARAAYARLPDKWEKVRLIVNLLLRQDKLGEIHNIVNEMEGKDYWTGQNILFEVYVKRESVRALKNLIRTLTNEHEPNPQLTRLMKRFMRGTERLPEDDRRSLFELIATHYPPLRREFEFQVCRLESTREQSPDVLKRFIVTYEKGRDVEQCKRWRGIYYEKHKNRKQAHEEYWSLENKRQAHFYVAESYHGEYARNAKNVDKMMAIKEYMEIRKRFYNTEATCQAYWRIGHLYAELGKKQEAVSALEELEKRFVGQPGWQVRARFQIAEWYRHWGNCEKAIESYRMVDRRYPGTAQQRQSIYNIGLCWEKLGEKDMAVRSFLSCIRRFDQTRIQSQAHNRLEVKYEIPDLQIQDMVNED